MDEDTAIIDSILLEEAKLNGEILDDDHHGWKTVSYPRRHRKTTHSQPENQPFLAEIDVFRSIDHHAEEQRRRVVEAQKAALEAVTGVTGDKDISGEDSGDDDREFVSSPEMETKKAKIKKDRKLRVLVSEAAAKIDADDLAAFLVDISGSYESQQDIQLMRFADYFGRAFGSVGSAQFPWMKMLKESNVAKMVDIPLCYVPVAVYKTSVDWLSQQSLDALGSFVLWLWDGVLADQASHQGTVKGSKKVAQQASSKSQVALFVVMGITLRRKPDVLISLLPILSQKYVGHDKLHLTVWLITQACQGDLVVGLYTWVRVLLPMLTGKSVNPQSRDLILQLAEWILGMPKAWQILLNGAIRKGERLVPPAALETLMRLTFPSQSSRVKATERFEAIYPTLKEVALAGTSGSKVMKLVTQQILNIAIMAAGEDDGGPELYKEASGVFIWCLTENPECYKQWDNLYLYNIKASALLLKKLYGEGKLQSAKSATLEPVKAALNSFRKKNENALGGKEHTDDQTSLKEADKYCKLLLARLSKGHKCVKALFAVSVALGAVAMVSKYLQFNDLEGLLSRFSFQL